MTTRVLPTLYVIATPIGNLEDVTFRAVRMLGGVDALACEDTRRTRRLLERYKIRRPKILFSYHEYNEEKAGARILKLLRDGLSVALCTNAGYPGVSDPGYRIVSEALDGGFHVEVVPGAGAVSTALLSSGLSTATYTFKGFPPKKAGPRRRFLEMESGAPHTLVLFESPHRLERLLADAYDVYGNRMAAVCVELTKKFETVRRGPLTELISVFRNSAVRGEVTVVIAGNNPKFMTRDEGLEDG